MKLLIKIRRYLRIGIKPSTSIKAKAITSNSLALETKTGFSTGTHLVTDRVSPLPQPKADDSVIGQDAVMTGCIKLSGRVIVQGRFSGVMEQGASGSNVYVDEEAVVRGDICASNALIYGVVEGFLSATLISVQATADVRGQIEYRDIRLKGGVSGVKLIKNDTLPLLTEDQVTNTQLLNQ